MQTSKCVKSRVKSTPPPRPEPFWAQGRRNLCTGHLPNDSHDAVNTPDEYDLKKDGSATVAMDTVRRATAKIKACSLSVNMSSYP